MSAPALVVLADMTQKGQPVSAEMLLAVFGVTSLITATISTLVAKKMGSKNPARVGLTGGGCLGFVVVAVVIIVIASHRM